MNAEVASVALWYGYLLLLGWAGFPLAFTLFGAFPDRGFSSAKTLGLLLSSYLVWIVGSLDLSEYQRFSCVVVLALYLFANLMILAVRRKAIGRFLKTHARLVIFTELLFAAAFFGALLIRIYNPDLTGAEKEADLTLLNALLHSRDFPPKDTWFAGASVNYYYFGYLIWATVVKVTGVLAPVGFNLALASTVGLAAVNSFGLVYRLTRRYVWGLSASCLLMLCGNLDGCLQILQRGSLFPFDWWRSSRIIPHTINEFPFFSFLLGDLHAHFMAIPFIVLLLAFLRQMTGVFQPGRPKPAIGALFLCLAVSLGASSVMNGWDYPTCALLTLGALFLALRSPHWRELSTKRRLLVGIAAGAALLAASRLLFWPFYAHFVPQAGLKNLRIVSSLQRTELRDFMIIYGLFLWGLLAYLYVKGRAALPAFRSSRQKRLALHGVVLATALFAVCVTEHVLILSASLSLLFLLELYRSSSESANTAFACGLLFMAFAILAGCEVIYIQDFYGHPLERQNTIFKFTYQAWILLAVGVPSLLATQRWQALCVPKALKAGWRVGLAALLGAACCYPLFATLTKTNHFQAALPYLPTLNGIRYMAYRDPAEYEALLWIQRHLEENAVILEATGPPYSSFGRVASATGRATVLGWGNHEALWRDQTWRSIMQRSEDIRAVYEASEKSLVQEIVRRYQIDYFYVGRLERESYVRAGLDAFETYYQHVYQNERVSIYAIAATKTVEAEK